MFLLYAHIGNFLPRTEKRKIIIYRKYSKNLPQTSASFEMLSNKDISEYFQGFNGLESALFLRTFANQTSANIRKPPQVTRPHIFALAY